MEEREALCDVTTSTEYLDWDLSNIDTSDIPILHDPVDLYLECQDDECYTVPPVQSSYIGPSLIGQNVNLQISFPETVPTPSTNIESKIYCLNCGQFFKTDKKLKDHLKDVHKIEKPYQCTLCEFKTTCLKLLNRHTKRCLKRQAHYPKDHSEISEKSHSIPSVGKRTTTQSNRKDILQDNTCLQDKTEYQTSNSIKIILDTDSQIEKTDTSTTKSKDTDNSSAKFRPNNLHASCKVDKLFQCNKCTFRTKTTKLLKCHIDTKHNAERSHLLCSLCNFQCKQQRTMKIHVASSHSEKIFKVKCDVCDKEFISLEKLKRHKLTHTNTRPFQCSECSKSFKLQSNLNDHMNYSHLKTHVKSNKKTIQCSWEGCDRLFRDKHNLNKHYKTHVNASYKCNLCLFQCVYEKVLNQHKEKCHVK